MDAGGARADAELCDPAELFRGAVLVLAPHMDDEVLACGGTIARISRKDRVHVVYATDGSGSPVPAARWLGSPPSGLSEMRMREAREALAVLGVPERNLRFLNLPDGRLADHAVELGEALGKMVEAIRPTHVLAPFRYDRHPDHVAVNQVVTSVVAAGRDRVELLEYFVYYRSRLLPRGDLRSYIRPGHLLVVDIRQASDAKRRALECFRSQTTRAFQFQSRPNLTAALLDEVCRGPELFVRYSPQAPGAAIFEGPRAWIRVAHRIEPLLKKGKDQIVELWRSRPRW